MLKLLSILLVGLVCESAGVVLLKKGINRIGDVNGYTRRSGSASFLKRCFSSACWC